MKSDRLKPVFAEILHGKPYDSRISGRLFETLLDCDGRTFNAVVGQLDVLEKVHGADSLGVKKYKQFRGPILQGLWHSHYFSGEHLLRNIELYFEGSPAERAALKRRIGEPIDDPIAVSGEIAQTIAGGYRLRRNARKLTGEWIIYGKWEQQNFYLDLSVHAELVDEQALYDRLASQCPEFYFLFDDSRLSWT
jgi:hypothetical protein